MTKKDILKLVLNIIFRQCDRMLFFIDDAQQRIYTVPRLE